MVLAFSLSTNAQDSTKVDNFQNTDEVLAEAVKKALIVAEKTGEFAIEQAPLLLKEFYAWHITKESLDTYYDDLGTTLGEALLAPTRIYVKALKSIKNAVINK